MKRIVILVSAIIFCQAAISQQLMDNVFDGNSDVGKLKFEGSVVFNPNTQSYNITASGENIWGNSDQFHFLWKVMEGDFVAYARIKFTGDNKEPHRKAGWMLRQSLEDNAPYVDGAIHGEGLTSLQYRKSIGGVTDEVKGEITSPDIIQLVRSGNTFTLFAAKDGEPLMQVASFTQQFGTSAYLGLFVCSHNEFNIQEVIFDNVRILKTAAPDKINSREGVTSNMEIVDIETLNRRIIHSENKLFEAPNWPAREDVLIFNMEGRLYKLPVTGGNPTQINTDFATALNNDHGISPDGKWIAISHHRQEATGGGSTIYVLPYEGGKPKLVTELSPSYWHGWSADSKVLAYVGERGNNNYDIYTIKRTGGAETRITDAECLDDGPDYTADGQYIYFNSCRSGTMQIWRMKPDGTGQEQITTDSYNDWFPHPSPDGKWIVFISYLPEVAPGNHPPNQHVMLRLMPMQGGEIKVIAHLYGGQGTINVPSWSPDSKKIAFVSYTY